MQLLIVTIFMMLLVHIYIFIANRLEIENPGGLFPGITLKDLGTRSVRRNRLICELFFRAKFIEGVGSGLPRINNSLEENSNPQYKVSSSNFFSIQFYPRLKQIKNLSLSARQRTLLTVLAQREIASKQELSSHLGVGPDSILRDLNVLIGKKLVEVDGVGKGVRYKLKKRTAKK